MLGPEYAAVDDFPTRVRLPDEPLMLVDRVLTIEGVPRSMHGGRIVTEHVVRPQAWYLDGGRIVPSIAIEAGQADLLLCGYLGVDFETKGLAVYRLLDATVTFHSALPREGDVIRYDIRIDEFLPPGQDDPVPVPARCDGRRPAVPVDARRLRGLLHARRAGGRPRNHPAHDRSALACRELAGDVFRIWFRRLPRGLNLLELEALRRGDLAGAFGPPFDRASDRRSACRCRAAG